MQVSNVFTSVPLTNVSLKYTTSGYISEKIAPIVQVVKDTGKIYSYGMDNLRIVPTYRSVGGLPTIVHTEVSSADHYSLSDHVIGEFIPEEVLENAESPIKPRIDTTEALTDRLWLDKEKALADVITNTSNITNNTTLSGTSQWNDYTNSDPIDDIQTAISTVRGACGKIPNTMIIAWDTMEVLKFHPNIMDMFPGTTPVITGEMVASKIGAIFNIQNVLIGMAQYNNSNKGGTDTLADIWSKDVVICYVEKTPRLKSRTFAYTYQKKAPRRVQVVPQGQGGLETMQRKSDYIQISDKYDQVLVDELCAYLIEAAIS